VSIIGLVKLQNRVKVTIYGESGGASFMPTHTGRRPTTQVGIRKSIKGRVISYVTRVGKGEVCEVKYVGGSLTRIQYSRNNEHEKPNTIHLQNINPEENRANTIVPRTSDAKKESRHKQQVLPQSKADTAERNEKYRQNVNADFRKLRQKMAHGKNI
jgi:hypothetical protein